MTEVKDYPHPKIVIACPKCGKDTGTWKDIKSAVRYRHAVTSEEAQKASLLPVPKKVNGP